MPSAKQNSLAELLRVILPHARNTLTWPWYTAWRRWKSIRSVGVQLELVHNMVDLLIEPEYTEADVWFINFQISRYVRSGDWLLPGIARVLVSFYDGVPDSLRRLVTWDMPDFVRALAQHEPVRLTEDAIQQLIRGTMRR